MSYETVAVSDRAFGWDDEIKNDGPDFVLLPEGELRVVFAAVRARAHNRHCCTAAFGSGHKNYLLQGLGKGRRAEKLRSPFSQPAQPSATADGYLPLSVMTARILQPVSAVSEVPAT